MTDLSKLLQESGIKKAVIIDDVFDDVPHPDELDDGDWSTFFDDLSEADHEQLGQLFSGYHETHRSELQASQEFISILWQNQQSLSAKAQTDVLFRDYRETKTTDRQVLEKLLEILARLGLSYITMGRSLDEQYAKDADLIFIDLFLDLNQSDNAMQFAIDLVSEFVESRRQNPPLIVLMSRSSRLWEKRNQFRDNAGLLGSTFRVASKADLVKTGKIETLLTRLASHYQDAKRVAEFVNAWDDGLDKARKNFIRILRRLDLPDLAQIRTLLLNFEGQTLGEYLLDIADRVLQHEIEAQSSTISASQELNEIDLEKYPAPHLTGTPDLQELVYRMLFQHEERQKLSSSDNKLLVNFGDILCRKDEKTDIATKEVLLVVTPACDLLRFGTKQVLVIPGELTALSGKDWSYGTTITKTPIFISLDGSRYWIKWDLKGYRTISLDDLRKLLLDEKSYVRIGRLREIYAIDIQQKMLADMGRIGQPANPPATFLVSLSLYLVSTEAAAVPIQWLDEAVCFVGKNEEGKRVDHLVLKEQTCDSLWDIIQNCSVDDVHSNARTSLNAMKTDLGFFEKFEKGLINVPVADNQLQEVKGSDNLVYMHIFRNEWTKITQSLKGNYRKAPLIIKICDIPHTLVSK